MLPRLVAFDFDGVITNGDTIPLIAKELRISAAIEPFRIAYREKLAAAKTKKEREELATWAVTGAHEVLSKFGRWEIEQACTKVVFIKGAKECLDSLRAAGVKILILSATAEFIVRTILNNLGVVVDDVIATGTSDGKLLGAPVFVVSGANKQELLERYLQKQKLKPKDVWAVADSVADYGMFSAVGKERSIGFNYQSGVEKLTKHNFFVRDDPKADLRQVSELVLRY